MRGLLKCECVFNLKTFEDCLRGVSVGVGWWTSGCSGECIVCLGREKVVIIVLRWQVRGRGNGLDYDVSRI